MFTPVFETCQLSVLGLISQDNCRFDCHVHVKLIKANKCLFILRSLRKEGYSQAELDHFFSSIVLPSITYGLPERGEFHISHDASLQTILSSFRTHVILSVQASSTGTRQLNNAGKRLLLPIKPSVPLLCRSIYDFRFTIPSISVVMSKRVFWPPIIGN